MNERKRLKRNTPTRQTHAIRTSFTRSSRWRSAMTARNIQRGVIALALAVIMGITAILLAAPRHARAAEGEVELTVGALVNYGGNSTSVMYADGKPAFCAQPDIVTPAAGTYARADLAPAGGDAALVRAVLYFGAGAPGQNEISWPLFVGYSGQTDFQKIWVDTHLLASYAWSGSLQSTLFMVDGSWAERREWFLYNLFGLSEDGRVTNETAPLQQIKKRIDEVPDDFYVYQINTGSSSQTIVSWEYSSRILITKRSDDPDLTHGNDAYSFEGATFQIFRTRDDALMGTVTTGSDGTASLRLPPNERYYAIETAAPAGYKRDERRHEFTVTAPDVTVEIADTPARLSLSLHKADAATGDNAQVGATFDSAEYQLTDASGAVHTATSDASGTLMFENLPLGNVTVVETKSPAGYTLDTSIHTFAVDHNDVHEDIQLTPDEPLLETPLAFDLEIVKYIDDGAEGSGLQTAGEGISFDIISNTTNDVVGTITTDQTGKATTSGQWFGSGERVEGIAGALPYDAAGYTVREDASTTPPGYQAAPDWTISAEQMVDGATLHYIVDNDFVSSRIHVVKVDQDSGEPIPLAGFTFQLLTADKTPISQNVWYPNFSELTEFTTDETGSVTFPEALLPGTYYLREVGAPEPYLISSEDIEIQIPDRADVPPVTVVTVADSRPTGTATITKLCAQDQAPLADAGFDVVAQEDIVAPDGSIDAVAGEVVDHVTTGDDGTASVVNLPLGSGSATYAFIETEAPEGHALDSTPHAFTLTYLDSSTPVILSETTAENEPTTVILNKSILGTDDPLSRAVFELWNAEDEPTEDTIRSVTTDDDGCARIDHLSPGTYYLKEASAPDGYLVNQEPITIVVDDQGRIEGESSHTITAEDDYTKVYISKRDVTNESEVPGATLSILDSEGNVIETWTSGDEEHRIDALPPGDYTLVEEMTPNSYDQTTSVAFTVEETGEIQRVVMYDEPIEVSGSVDKRQEIADPTAELTEADGDGQNRAKVSVSDDGSYDYSIDFQNTSSTWVDEFTVTDHLDMALEGTAKLTGITTPVVDKDYDGLFNVWYQTNATPADYLDESGANATLSDAHENPWLTHESTADRLGDDSRVLDYHGWKLWKADVDATSASTLSVDDLSLAPGEVVTAIRFEFGRVEEGFTSRTSDWDREDLKHPHDDVDDISYPSANASKDGDGGDGDDMRALSGIIVHMRVTDAYQEGATIANSASLDLYRNGGDIGDETHLEDHDEDAVEQTPRAVVAPLAKTDGQPIIPALTSACGIAAVSFALLSIWKRGKH